MTKRFFWGPVGVLVIVFAVTVFVVSSSFAERSAIGAASDKVQYESVTKSNERPAYRITARFDEKTGLLSGQMRVQVPNISSKRWSSIYFNLYPNAFRDWEFHEAAAPTKEGYIDVSDVKVNGVPVQPFIHKTVMKVNLPEPLPGRKRARVDMNFTLQLPRGGMRLNYVENTAFLAQWYPMLAQYDEEGWHKNPYTTVGDPFYSGMADFQVVFHVPRGYRVISSADDRNNRTEGVVTLSQQNVRDFAAVLTQDYKAKTVHVDGTAVNVWYRDAMADVTDELLRAATKGLRFFNEKFGQYSYAEIDVVLGETGRGIAGMEYPGLVTSVDRISTRYGEEPAVSVVVHELAHQWWYGMVGNNQAKEPWLDEGLTTFSESLFMSEVMGRPEREMYKQAAASSEQIHEKKGLTAVQMLYDYPEQLYGLMVYARPAAMLWDLTDRIGQDNVIRILQTYFRKYKNRIATTKDFIRVAEAVTGSDLRPFFNKWLYFRS